MPVPRIIVSSFHLALCLALCLAVTLLVQLPTAQAQPAGGDTALAEALFRDARALMKNKKYEEACPKFEESYRLVAKLGTLLNLAACHDEQGKTGSAWGEYTKAVTEAKAAGETGRVKFAREKLEALEGRLTKIVVEVPSPVPGIDVVVGAQTIRKAAFGTPIPLDPGEHELVARAPGHRTLKKTVVLPEGPSTIVETLPALEPLPEGEEEPQPDDPVPSDDSDGISGQAIAGWVVGAVGLVGLGVGAGFGVSTLMKNGDSDDFCNERNECVQQGVDLRDEALTSAHISTAAFAVGGAALVAGIILIVTAPSGSAEETEAARTWLAPHPVPGGAMLSGGVVW